MRSKNLILLLLIYTKIKSKRTIQNECFVNMQLFTDGSLDTSRVSTMYLPQEFSQIVW